MAEQSISVEGPGSATLNFRVYAGSLKNAPPTMAIFVTVEGPVREDRVFGPVQHLLTVKEAEARAFLQAMLKGQIALVMGIGDNPDQLDYAVTEQAHTFTVYRHGNTRALHRFTVGWSQGIDWIAKPLLAKLDECEADTAPTEVPASIVNEPVTHAAPVMPLPSDVADLQRQLREKDARVLDLERDLKAARDMVALYRQQRGE